MSDPVRERIRIMTHRRLRLIQIIHDGWCEEPFDPERPDAYPEDVTIADAVILAFPCILDKRF
jgi:hypothetical protein